MELGFIACKSIELTIQIAKRRLERLELGGRLEAMGLSAVCAMSGKNQPRQRLERGEEVKYPSAESSTTCLGVLAWSHLRL